MGTIISAEDLDKLEDVEPVIQSTDAAEKAKASADEAQKPIELPSQEDPASAVKPNEIEAQEPVQVASQSDANEIQAPEPQPQAPSGPVISAEALDAMDGETIDFEQFDENNVINKSPLGFFERSAVSYATEKRKKSYLEERFGKNNIKETKEDNKYFIRNRDGKWYREDPTIGASFRFSADAMKEMAADALADIQPELIRLAGQGAGAVAGAGAGAPIALPTLGQSVTTGALGGAAVGRAAGQGIVELAGKLNGMRPETTLQDAFVEMGRQAAYGASNEVLGPYMAKGLQKAVSIPGKMISGGMSAIGSKLQSAVNKNKAFGDFLDSFWGGVAGIPKDAAKRMRELGKNVINNPKYRDVENTVEPLLINGTKALENYEQEASKQYAQTVKKAAKVKVWVMDVYDAMRGALQGKINPLTGTRTSNVASPAEGRDLDKLAEYFSGMLKIKGLRFNPTAAGKASVIRKGEMTLGQLKSMITDIDDRIAQWSSEGASYMARMGRQVRYALTQVLHKNPEYLAADKEFEAVQFFLKSLNVIDKNMSGIDKFLKSYSSLPEWLKARLWKLEKSLPKDKQFLEEGLTMAAANVWNELGKLNFASLAQLGLGRYFGGNLGLGLAFLVRNPKLLQKFVFGSFEQAPNFVKSVATGAGNVAEKAGRAAAFLGTEKIGRTLEEAVAKPMGIAEASEPTQKKSPDSGSNAEIWEEIPTKAGEKLSVAASEKANPVLDILGSKAVEALEKASPSLGGAGAVIGKLSEFVPGVKGLELLGRIDETVGKTLTSVAFKEDVRKAIKSPELVPSFQDRILEEYYSRKDVQKAMSGELGEEAKDAAIVKGYVVSAAGLIPDMIVRPSTWIIPKLFKMAKGVKVDPFASKGVPAAETKPTVTIPKKQWVDMVKSGEVTSVDANNFQYQGKGVRLNTFLIPFLDEKSLQILDDSIKSGASTPAALKALAESMGMQDAWSPLAGKISEKAKGSFLRMEGEAMKWLEDVTSLSVDAQNNIAYGRPYAGTFSSVVDNPILMKALGNISKELADQVGRIYVELIEPNLPGGMGSEGSGEFRYKPSQGLVGSMIISYGSTPERHAKTIAHEIQHAIDLYFKRDSGADYRSVIGAFDKNVDLANKGIRAGKDVGKRVEFDKWGRKVASGDEAGERNSGKVYGQNLGEIKARIASEFMGTPAEQLPSKLSKFFSEGQDVFKSKGMGTAWRHKDIKQAFGSRIIGDELASSNVVADASGEVKKISVAIPQSRGAGKIPAPVSTPRVQQSVEASDIDWIITKNPDKFSTQKGNPIVMNADYGPTFTPDPSCEKGKILRNKTIEIGKVLEDAGMSAEVKTAARRKLFEAGLKQNLETPCIVCYEYEKQLTGFNAKPMTYGSKIYQPGMIDASIPFLKGHGNILRGYGVGDFKAADINSILALARDLQKHGTGYGQYTKNLNLLEIAGDIGFKFNISTGATTELGIPLSVAEKYLERYPNAGTVYVAINESDLHAAGEDPRVHHLIPTHLGGGTPEWFLKNATGLEIKNFQSSQSEKVAGKVLHSAALNGKFPAEKLAAARKLVWESKNEANVEKYKAALKKASEILGQEVEPMFKDYKLAPWYHKLIGNGPAEYGQTPDLPKIDISKFNFEKAKAYMLQPDINTADLQLRYGEIANKIVNAAKRGGAKAVNALDARYLSLLAGAGAASGKED